MNLPLPLLIVSGGAIQVRERGASQPPACIAQARAPPTYFYCTHEMVLELKYEKETKVGLWQQRCEAFLYNSKIRSHVVYYVQEERLAPF